MELVISLIMSVVWAFIGTVNRINGEEYNTAIIISSIFVASSLILMSIRKIIKKGMYYDN